MAKARTVIITGGSSGIGKQTAIMLAEKRVNLVICSRSQAEIDSTISEITRMLHCEVLGVRCNVAVNEEVASLVKQTLDRFGDVDILINNAGILHVKKLADTTEEEWDEMINTNLKGAFLCSKFVFPHMISKNSGTIINIACGAGRVGFENCTAYCASKFGMVGLTESLAWEVSNYNIRVMSVCPGEVDTRMQQTADPEYYNANKHLMLNPRSVAERIKQLIYDDLRYLNGHSEDIYNVIRKYEPDEE